MSETPAIPIGVDAATVKGWLDEDAAVLVDVREAIEWTQERIAGARLVPLSTLRPDQVPAEPGKKLVLHCAVGQRSFLAGQVLMQAGFPTPYNLSEGIEGWKAAGLATEVGPPTG